VWALIATHPSGQQEDVIGFHTEEEAKQWRKAVDTAHGFEREAIWSNPVTKKDRDQRLVWLINADFFDHASYRLPISEVRRIR
jgi:hypothetical protein